MACPVLQASLLIAWQVAVAEPAPARPTVNVVTLAGAKSSGAIKSFDDERLSLDQASPASRAAIPTEDLLRIEFAKAPGSAPPSLRLQVHDDSRFLCQGIVLKGDELSAKLHGGTDIRLGAREIASVLLTPLADAEAGAWLAKSAVRRSSDVLTVARDGKLHDIEGIVSEIGDATLTLLLDGESIPVKRERVYGVRFAQKSTVPQAVGVVIDRFGNRWGTGKFSWEQGSLRIVTTWGETRTFSQADLVALDFSRGRIAFLSELSPTVVQSTPFFDINWDYRRDMNLDGKPIRVAGAEFARGLTVHSKTLLEYDVGGGYRRFETVLGIEDGAGPLGDAIVRIRGDDRVLAKERVRAGASGKALSLAIEGVQKLVLDVDYGERYDLGDHVVFGDARLIK